MVIIGILSVMGIKKYTSMIVQAKSTEAKEQLLHIHTLQHTFFLTNFKYSDSFSEINYEPEKLVTEEGTANYQLEITAAGGNEYSATATAVVDFDYDGVFNVWSINQDGVVKEVVPD